MRVRGGSAYVSYVSIKSPATPDLGFHLYDIIAVTLDDNLPDMLPALHQPHGVLYLGHPEGGDG